MRLTSFALPSIYGFVTKKIALMFFSFKILSIFFVCPFSYPQSKVRYMYFFLVLPVNMVLYFFNENPL